MTKNLKLFLSFSLILAANVSAQNDVSQPATPKQKEKIEASFQLPYERPIGFTYNLGALSSMTFEGRFLLGLFPHVLFVASPSFQKTPELPFYSPKKSAWSVFDIMRFNLGVGLRGHFYEYDSWDGFYIEGMGRGGMTWIGGEDFLWSIIPSLMIGYSTVYDSGYSVSFGVGLEWEFTPGYDKAKAGYYTAFLKDAYYGITKLPLTGELSLGWTW